MLNFSPLAACMLFAILPALPAQPLNLRLPTANDALFRGDFPAFYQYVERDFHNEKTNAWEGGQYGFVRDPIDSPAGVIYLRFHEGIDIKPLLRDPQGEPLDDILAVAPGKVVHASDVPGASNYGRYVVVEHMFDGCPYYSLYAHLSQIYVTEGQQVEQGAKLARMGHTGEGIDKPRSHVHFELNVMLSTGFDTWYQSNSSPTDPNKHGNYNGQNLAGMDVGRLYLALRKNPSLTIPEFMGQEEAYFRALLPAGPQPPDLLRLYPWMGSGGGATAVPASWEISFTRSGLPLTVRPSATKVDAPTLSYIQPAMVPYWQLTHRLVYGTGSAAVLSPYGKKLVELIGQTAMPVSAAQTAGK